MDRPIEQTIEELFKAARAADTEDKERAQLFRSMTGSAAWKAYVELLESKLQTFSEALLAPAGSVDGMVALEYVKGAMSGLVLARDLPSVIIAAMDALIRDQRAAGRREEEYEFDDDGA